MPLENLDHKLKRNRNYKPAFKKVRLTKVIVIGLIFLIFLILPLITIGFYSQKMIKSGKFLAAGAKQENLDMIKIGISDTKASLNIINFSMNFLVWLKVVPFIGGYYSDAKHLINAGVSELQAGEIILQNLEQYKTELGLTGQVTPGQDRIAQAVKILDKTLPEIDKIEPYLKKARVEAEKINTNKYPTDFKNLKVKNLVEEAKYLIIGVHLAVTDGKAALKIAPEALGQNSPKTYLILFQNDKELRPTGGFLTAFTFVKLDKGHLSTTTSDDIYRLDEQLLKVCLNKICPLTPPEPIVKYLPEMDGKPRKAWSLRDSNLSPDLKISLEQFEKLYVFLPDATKFDGIITIDTKVVEELINLTGPIEIFGTTYSGDKDNRCNCPNVIFELENYAEVVSKGEKDRKAILGTLMQQILTKVLGLGTAKMPNLITTGVNLATNKHIMFYNHDPKIQQALEDLNWSGRIKNGEGDYLHINEANFAGGKTNLYVEEKVTLDIDTKSTQEIKHKLTIEYKNPYPFGTWLNTILRDYVRIYVPYGSKLINSKGSDETVNTKKDEQLNKTYFEAFIQVRPQNSRTLSFEYTTSNNSVNKNYPFLIQKQPGAKFHHYTIKINGQTKAEFDLASDQKLNLPL